MSEYPEISIVIATRNRAGLLTRAIESCMAQEGTEFEVLVYDDASMDNTSEVVAELFPDVRLFTNSRQHGYIHSRNRGFRDARSPIVVSIDDDALFSDEHTLLRVKECFDGIPEAAAVAIPYVEPFSSTSTLQHALSAGTRVRNFVGCAHAVRRESVLAVGGYVEKLVHQGEERDLCIRLLEAGKCIVYAEVPPIIHLYSANRDRVRVNYYGFRNTLLFNWMRVPFPYWIWRNLRNTIQLLTYRLELKTLPLRLRALAAGWIGVLSCWRLRKPVSAATYGRFRRLPSHGPLSLQQLGANDRQAVEEIMQALNESDSAVVATSHG